MLTLAKIFGKSPFGYLVHHMEKVSLCIHKLCNLLAELAHLSEEQIIHGCEEISKLEHEADLLKSYLRNHLPSTLFLPIERWQLLEILTIQDDIADKAEDIAKKLTLKKGLTPIPELLEQLKIYVEKNLETFEETHKVIAQLDNLLEVGFGGAGAQKVSSMIDKVLYKDYESCILREEMLKSFLAISDQMPQSSFWIWTQVISEIGEIAHTCDRLVHRLRMILTIKPD